jgi:hypothetical protein
VYSPATGGLTPTLSPGGMATTPQGGVGVGGVLPEELDVDMEVEEPPQPQLPAITGSAPAPYPPAQPHTAAGAGSTQQQQQQGAGPGARGTTPAAIGRSSGRQFGSAALARRAQAAAAGAAGGKAGGSTGSVTPPPQPGSSGSATPATPAGSSRRSGFSEAAQCFAEYPTVALQALQHNLSQLDTPAYKCVPAVGCLGCQQADTGLDFVVL